MHAPSRTRAILACLCPPLAAACLVGYLALNAAPPPAPGEPRSALRDLLRERGHHLAAGALAVGLVPALFDKMMGRGRKG